MTKCRKWPPDKDNVNEHDQKNSDDHNGIKVQL